jgi:hypothetical protein
VNLNSSHLVSDTVNCIVYFLFRPLFSELKPTLHGLVMHDKITVPKNKIKEKMVNT